MPVEEPLYPVNLRVAGRRCLVVGGGRVAADKVAGLLECDAFVHVVAPEIGELLAEMVAAEVAAPEGGDRLTWDQRPYRAADLDGRMLVITATATPATNHQVFLDAQRAGVLVNSADDPANCTFTLPSRVRRGRLLVTFSTGGHSPALATWLRRRFEAEFGPEYDTLIDVLADARQSIRAEGRSTEGLDWQEALDSGMLELIREGRVAEAKERLQACLSS
ncbi:MAG: bifunctional precorrin-2 dehydrogenase/sirohydrochlorin ferrochelatase [Acidimicrobiales bacterium]|nr:bifunctional precorrin-2 dehydrogenase/sirohydrochlorin ferrochelatase [Acidimicrobiales bacterium]